MTDFTLEREGPAARLTLRRAPLNTLTVPFMKDMTAAVRDLLPARPHALVIESALEGSFCHGVDPAAILGADLEGRKEIFHTLGEFIATLRFSGVPIICDVNGPAFAGGAVLATLADVTLIDAEAGRIAFSEIKVGLPLPRFVQTLVKAKVAPGAWTDVMLLGRNFGAAEAIRCGLAPSRD